PAIAWVSFDWRFHQVTHYVAFDGRTVQFGNPYEHSVVISGVSTDFLLINKPWLGLQWISKATFEPTLASCKDMATGEGGCLCTLSPTATNPSHTSSVNWAPGETRANLATVAVGPNGMVGAFNAKGLADLVLDVEGCTGRARAEPTTASSTGWLRPGCSIPGS